MEYLIKFELRYTYNLESFLYNLITINRYLTSFLFHESVFNRLSIQYVCYHGRGLYCIKEQHVYYWEQQRCASNTAIHHLAVDLKNAAALYIGIVWLDESVLSDD